MSIPPDRLEPFELLKLLHAQRLDLSHAQVGALLAEVERLRGETALIDPGTIAEAVEDERDACATVADDPELRDWPLNNCCAKTQSNIVAAIRARGDGK